MALKKNPQQKRHEKIKIKTTTKNRKISKEEKNKIIKIKTYIPGFDDLFNEGIPTGSAVLVEGGPGSGKTIFCLEIANNACKRDKKVLYMSFEETEERLKII